MGVAKEMSCLWPFLSLWGRTCYRMRSIQRKWSQERERDSFPFLYVFSTGQGHAGDLHPYILQKYIVVNVLFSVS